MDDYDYINSSDNDPEKSEGPEQQASEFKSNAEEQGWTYHVTGAGRKETVDQPSYYSYTQRTEQENNRSSYSQPWNYPRTDDESAPVPFAPKKKKSSGGMKPWLRLLISCGVSAAVAVMVCGIMLSSVKKNSEKLSESFHEKLSAIEAQLQGVIDKNNAFRPQLPGLSTPDTATPNAPNGDYTMTPAQVYASCADSVVAINGTSSRGSSSGSGFILSEDGYVATNYHVVEGQAKLTVSTGDGKKYSAEYIGGNEANDIALIKMEAEGLQPVKVGNSSELVVGEQVAAIGNPLGELASTLTVGYISAKDRVVTTDGTRINMLQTDAAINSGNSGGPLFNMRGEVVGITSAKYSGTTNSGATIEGIGFAIPMDDVMGMFNDLREHGYITGGYLGIEASDVDQNASELYGLPRGALVRMVEKGSCAEKAGMKVQDIIMNVGGHQVNSLNDLSRALNKFDAGDEVKITVYRSGQELALTVILDERPKELSDASTNSQATVPTQPSIGGGIEDWFDFFLP